MGAIGEGRSRSHSGTGEDRQAVWIQSRVRLCCRARCRTADGGLCRRGRRLPTRPSGVRHGDGRGVSVRPCDSAVEPTGIAASLGAMQYALALACALTKAVELPVQAVADEAPCVPMQERTSRQPRAQRMCFGEPLTLLGTAAHRVLSLGVLPYRPGRCRSAHGCIEVTADFLFFKSKGGTISLRRWRIHLFLLRAAPSSRASRASPTNCPSGNFAI